MERPTFNFMIKVIASHSGEPGRRGLGICVRVHEPSVEVGLTSPLCVRERCAGCGPAAGAEQDRPTWCGAWLTPGLAERGVDSADADFFTLCGHFRFRARSSETQQNTGAHVVTWDFQIFPVRHPSLLYPQGSAILNGAVPGCFLPHLAFKRCAFLLGGHKSQAFVE